MPWRGQTFSVESASKAMKINALMAAAQHYSQKGVYASPKEIHKLNESESKHSVPLKYSTHSHASKSLREKMEDTHFCKKVEKGILAGIFDGHGGKEVSFFASEEFQQRFPKALEIAKGNVHNAFETVIHQIHQDIVKNVSWNNIGSTAVICYINKKTNEVFTATLGDCEANIYRRYLLRIKSIPLSVIHNWRIDYKRLMKVFGADYVVAWFRVVRYNLKNVRSRLYEGVNVSRAFGDVNQTGTPSSPLVTHEPTITVHTLHSGDTLVLTSDGLKDAVKEQEIANIVNKVHSLRSKISFNKQPPLAEQLVDAALKNMTEANADNVTVLTIEVT